VYRDMRYVLDRGHPLQPLAQMWLCFEVLVFVSKYLTVVEAVGICMVRRQIASTIFVVKCFGSAQMYPACLWS